MIQKSLILVLLTVSLAGAVSMSHHLHEKSHEKAVKRSPHASALLELATAQQGDTGAMNEIVKMIDEKLIPDLKTTVETLKTNLAKAYAKFGECSSAKATCDGAIGVLDKAVTDAKALIAAKTTERDDAAKPATCTEPSFSGSDATSARDSAISAYTTAITARAAKYNTAATALASATTALGTAETAFGEKVGACKSACTTCNNDARTAYAALVEEAKKKQPYQREDLKTYELIKCVAKESGGGNDSTVLANCRTATPDLTWIAYDLKDMPYIHCEAGGTPVPAKVSKPVGCLDTSVVGTIKATGSGWTCGTCGDKPMVTSLTEGVSGFSFKIPDTTLHIMIGFGTGSDPCAHPGWEMAFGLCLRGQWDAKGIDIYESGVTSGVHNRLSRPYAAGDTFAVQIVDGKMVYQQNGATFFTSAVNVAAYLPLTFDFSVYTPSGNAITDIKTLIYPAPTPATSGGTSTTAEFFQSGTTGEVTVTELAGGRTVCNKNGADHPGALTTEQFSATSKYMGIEFSNPGPSYTHVGLTHEAVHQIWSGLDFAWSFVPGGNVQGTNTNGAYGDPKGYPSAGKVYSVVVNNAGKVEWREDGVVKRTSDTAISAPLHGDMALHLKDTCIKNLKLVLRPV